VVAGRPEDSVLVPQRQPEPLIRLNCTGTARPAAAQSWTPDSAHRTWTFVLAPSTVPVSATSVAAEWAARPQAATTLRQAGVASVIPLDDERLAVSLSSPSDSVPPVFADRTLSLATDSLPKAGTAFVFRHPETADLRDALDAGADILRTVDPDLAEYARHRGEFVVHPLPWSRTYLLIIPAGRAEFGRLIQGGDSAGFRGELARDAVHADARGTERPFWWDGLGQCPGSDSLPPPRPRVLVDSNAVAFATGDAIARSLAERVVALSDNPRLSIGSIPQRLLGEALTAATARAYVVAVPRVPLLPCREIVTWPPDPVVVPLIDVRESAIVRRGLPALTVDFDGRLRPVEAP
jgi:hypothetical protein